MKKLQLNRETLRHLTNDDLRHVVGGTSANFSTCWDCQETVTNGCTCDTNALECASADTNCQSGVSGCYTCMTYC